MSGSAATSVIAPIYSMLATDPILTYSKQFAWMRWKSVSVRFLVLSNPLQYGFICINYIPFTDSVAGARDVGATYTGGQVNSRYNTNSYASYNPIILNIAPNEEATMEIPWHCPVQWLNPFYEASSPTVNPTYDWALNVGGVNVFYIIPPNATDTTALKNIEVKVFVKYNGLEFGGPFATTAYSESRARPPPECDGQMDQIGNALMDNAVKFGVKTAASFSFEKATSKVWDWMTDGSTGRDSIPESQTRETKFEPFNDSAELNSPHPTKTLGDFQESGSMNRCSDPQRRHSIQELCMKPFLLQAGVFTNINDSTDCTCHPRYPFGSSYPTPTDTLPGIIGILPSGYMPYLAQFFRFFRGSFKFKLYLTTSAMCSARIRIFCAYGTSASSVSSNAPYTELLPTIIHTVKGTTSIEFSVPFVYQYDWVDMSSAYEYGVCPSVNIVLDSAITGSGSRTPTIQYLLYMAAGEDFQFRDYSTPGYAAIFATALTNSTSTTSTTMSTEDTITMSVVPEADGQCSVWEDFLKPFPSLPHMKPTGDIPQTHVPEYTYVEDLLTRWSDCSNALTSFDVGCSSPQTGTQYRNFQRVRDSVTLGLNGHINVFDSICNLFFFNSGAVNWKLALPPNVTVGAMPYAIGKIAFGQFTDVAYGVSTWYPETGIVTQDPSQWKVFDVTTPWQGSIPWDTYRPVTSMNTGYATRCQPYGQSWSGAPATLWKSAAPSFELALLMPVPDPWFWPLAIFSNPYHSFSEKIPECHYPLYKPLSTSHVESKLRARANLLQVLLDLGYTHEDLKRY